MIYMVSLSFSFSFFLFLAHAHKKAAAPGIEPGSPGRQPGMLTSTPYGLNVGM